MTRLSFRVTALVLTDFAGKLTRVDTLEQRLRFAAMVRARCSEIEAELKDLRDLRGPETGPSLNTVKKLAIKDLVVKEFEAGRTTTPRTFEKLGVALNWELETVKPAYEGGAPPTPKLPEPEIAELPELSAVLNDFEESWSAASRTLFELLAAMAKANRSA